MTDSDDILAELSALVDGELPADRSAFVLRRLAHDPALRATWERWHLVSACLSPGSVATVSPDFSGRIAGRIASETAPRRSIPASMARWAAGGAVAAAVAVFALVALEPGEPLPAGTAMQAAQAPAEVAPSPLIESDLQPRFRAPAQTVAASQPLPMIAVPVADSGLDARAQAYLVRHQSALRDAGLVQFAPYVDVLAHAQERGRNRGVDDLPAGDRR